MQSDQARQTTSSRQPTSSELTQASHVPDSIPHGRTELEQVAFARSHLAMPSNNRSISAGSIGRTKATLEIIPDTRFVVFRGNEHEASACKLSGIVRLTTPTPTSISKPKIRFEGTRKVTWMHATGMTGDLYEKKTFWTEEQRLGSIESPHKVKAGVIEWPFEFELSPSMPESVEGINNTYAVYHLHASVSRPGWSAKDLVAQEHIRIVRTLGADALESSLSRVNSDLWAGKISYTISIPTDAFVFGTSITADVELCPIKKGLRIGQIEMRLNEHVVRRLHLADIPGVGTERSKTEEREVARAEMAFPETSRVMHDYETVDSPAMDDEVYRFKATLPLPKSLNKCRQDVDSHQITITHKFKLLVNLHNPEGHVSQLVCRLPVKLFISPNLPVNEQNEVCRPVNGVTDETLNNRETTIVAPPRYEQHQLDELFSDIDLHSYVSRAPSHPGSPGSYARHGFEAEAFSGDPSSVHNDSPMENYQTPSAVMLRARLANLEEERRFEAAHSRPASRRGSGDESGTDVRRNDYDMEDLSRVPSYRHATRIAGTITPHLDGPPTYIEATSRPASPQGRAAQRYAADGVDTPPSQVDQARSPHALAGGPLSHELLRTRMVEAES